MQIPADPLTQLAPLTRFSQRVRDYALYRPSYPSEVVRVLEREAGIEPNRTRVVDVGCGTGISAALFEREGYTVTGIEPNLEMREEAAQQLAGSSRFRVLAGTAEQIPLPDSSCELAVAAQAFHWFEPALFRKELLRVLVPNGWVALLWNDRRTDSTPFLRAYEQLLQTYGTDYALVTRGWDEAAIAQLFGTPNYAQRAFENHQDFDLRGLIGRALSSSYVPGPEHPARERFVRALEAVFSEHAQAGTVRFEYDTRLHFGRLS